MRLLRSARLLLLALLVSLVPASSYAGVFISVGFAPPMLPVYDQPPCPEPGLMWTPGYWGYGPDGYYWVPGAWVPAPYDGALWTPGYWGWGDDLYMWHPGYWGDHVGYYGGVNYGFGYMGIGFAGGMWRGHNFFYNSAIMNVDRGRFHNNMYEDRTIINNTTIINNNHVSFSGGRGGIQHQPRPEERMADHDRHMGGTQSQMQHENAARSDRSFYFKNNGGHPSTTAVSRPMSGGQNSRMQGGASSGARQGQQNNQNQQRNSQVQQQQNQQRNSQVQQQQQNQQRNNQVQQNQQRNQNQQIQNQQRSNQVQQQNNQNQQRNQQQQQRNQQQNQQRSTQQQSRPAQQSQPAAHQQSAPQQKAAPKSESHEKEK
jgi:hypothetical protein